MWRREKIGGAKRAVSTAEQIRNARKSPNVRAPSRPTVAASAAEATPTISNENTSGTTVILIAFLLVAPVAEEIFFRGVVFNAWERERGVWVAVIGSALLFAAIHTSLFALVPIFALGVTLALVYRSTRSLAATIALHAGFNAISVAIALLERQGIITLPT